MLLVRSVFYNTSIKKAFHNLKKRFLIVFLIKHDVGKGSRVRVFSYQKNNIDDISSSYLIHIVDRSMFQKGMTYEGTVLEFESSEYGLLHCN